jgi:hypothetical protein
MVIDKASLAYLQKLAKKYCIIQLLIKSGGNNMLAQKIKHFFLQITENLKRLIKFTEIPKNTKYPRIFVDFHNADTEGRIRLNCIGTTDDLNAQKIQLEEGKILILHTAGDDDTLEFYGMVQYSEEEKIWVATIDWEAFSEKYTQ